MVAARKRNEEGNSQTQRGEERVAEEDGERPKELLCELAVKGVVSSRRPKLSGQVTGEQPGT